MVSIPNSIQGWLSVTPSESYSTADVTHPPLPVPVFDCAGAGFLFQGAS